MQQKGYLYSTSWIEYFRTGFSSFKQNSARGGRGFRLGFGLRIGGLGGLRAGAATAACSSAPVVAPACAAGGDAATAAESLGDDALLGDASVVMLRYTRFKLFPWSSTQPAP